jgi:hypothetical protein
MCLVECSRQVPGFLGDFENRKKVGKFDFNKVLRSKSKDREQKMKTNKELTVHLVVNLRFSCQRNAYYVRLIFRRWQVVTSKLSLKIIHGRIIMTHPSIPITNYNSSICPNTHCKCR